jgi:hypothetical protein
MQMLSLLHHKRPRLLQRISFLGKIHVTNRISRDFFSTYRERLEVTGIFFSLPLEGCSTEDVDGSHTEVIERLMTHGVFRSLTEKTCWGMREEIDRVIAGNSLDLVLNLSKNSDKQNINQIIHQTQEVN